MEDEEQEPPEEEEQEEQEEEEEEPEHGIPSGCAAAEPQAGAIWIIDPALDEKEGNALAAGLGRPVRLLAVRDLEEALEGGGAEGIVVAWDQGGWSGLDLVESLRRASGPLLPIVVAAPVATRGRVAAAVRAGASAFVLQPYEPGELARRLPPAGAPRAPSEPGDLPN